ncbi:MAG: putative lipid II flippase FtsW [Firmicutes bacterium]|nr:putative lipid II flippase FtsW [Bacillota bacterium]
MIKLKQKKSKSTEKFALEVSQSGKFDIPLFIVTIVLVVFGIIMVFSASSYSAAYHQGNRYYFMNKQIIGAVAGFAAFFGFMYLDYKKLFKFRYAALIVSYILLALVFIPGLGLEVYGARRWIRLPFFTLQPSEIAKFGLIIFTAAYMSKNHDKMRKFKTILPVLGAGSIMALLIILEPNMSITMCVILLMLSMLFLGGMKIKHFIIIMLPIFALVPILIIMEPYRMNRLVAFLNPWASPLAEGYQLIQSFYSLGSGGLFGLGLFNSRQKYMFLPFAESDFIFSIIGEELGLIGAGVVILLFIIMIARAIVISQRAQDRFGSYLASGIAAIIAIQVLINIAVVTGSIPPTGLPLPFISAGSSSLVVFLSGIGILQSISIRSHKSIRSLK